MNTHNIVVFGEVLYDCFPDGRKIPGGAPFNVAWNLQALGQSPLFVSSIGNDQMGEELKALAENWGLSAEGIKVVEKVPTSTVEVELEDGIPSYTIVEDTAMDHIEVPSVLDSSSGKGKILYHGSLAARAQKTFSTVSKLRSQWKGSVFLDINIRNPHFDAGSFLSLVKGVDYLKINDEELAELLNTSFDFEKASDLLQQFAEEHAVRNIILTCGKRGAFWYEHGDDLKFESASKGVSVVDTVGAGDAFASVCLHGISEGWNSQEILEKAAAFAGKVCGLRGATTKDKEFYRL